MIPISRRGIVRHEQFTAQLDAIAADWPRAFEVLEGIEWALARDPRTYGILMPDMEVWRCRHTGSPQLPAVLIYYAFSGRILYMLSLQYAASE